MKKIVLFTLFLTFITTKGNTQQSNFNLSNALPVFSNPSLTGTAQAVRLNYGLEFLTNAHFHFPYHINYLSADLAVKKLHGGIGIQFYNSNQNNNIFNQSTAQLSYAFHQNLGKKWVLSLGVSAGISRKKIDFEKLTFGDLLYPTDSLLPSLKSIRYSIPYNAGFALYHSHWLVTFTTSAASNQLIIKQPTSKYTLRNTFQLGYKLTPFNNKPYAFVPLIAYSNQNGFQTVKFQLTFNTPRFSVGTAVSTQDNIAVHAGFYRNNFQIKYQFSQIISTLSPQRSTVNTLVLQYLIPSKREKNTPALNIQLF